ncbi:MAG TPA: hypothetical protein PLZ12_20245 [Saprospiraceae bacterium]|nr:hypothetical protein [Anaerolineales bacterium]HRK83785.1 hypothetical protein [Saprospiraceae bacterium]
MTIEQERIWQYLVENALGIANVINIEDIARALEISPHGTNNDDVRGWIKDMVIQHGKPIGTCKNGAFIILNDDEREVAAKFVERNNRADAVRRNGNYIP